MKFDVNKLEWTREPKDCFITPEKIEIITNPHTDLWQRTYYHFRNDNAPVLQMETSEKFFSFTVKTEFESKHRFDQCGIVMYLDSENWLKGSIEYENERFQHLGSVVTNNGLLYLNKCECVICGMVMELFALGFMRVAQRIHHLNQHLQIWKLQNVNGWHITGNSQIETNNSIF